MDRREVDHKWYKSFDKRRMTMIFVDGDGDDYTIPAVYEVCGTCYGHGEHVNPSIDSQGLSAEDFAEDPDFAEMYFAGLYDVKCNECGGEKVVPVPDDDRLTEAEKLMVERTIDAHRNEQLERDYERRMGC